MLGTDCQFSHCGVKLPILAIVAVLIALPVTQRAVTPVITRRHALKFSNNRRWLLRRSRISRRRGSKASGMLTTPERVVHRHCPGIEDRADLRAVCRLLTTSAIKHRQRNDPLRLSHFAILATSRPPLR